MNRNAPLNRGCVGWYLAMPWRDARWFNLAQNRNHGQLKNGVSWANTGSAGTLRPGGYGSMAFDNSDDYVLLRSGGILATKTNASVFVWVYRNVGGGTDTIYSERNGNALWRLQCNGLGANKIEFYHRDDAATLSGGVSTTSVNSGEPWAHVGIVKLGTGITFYRNGYADGTMTLSGTDTLTISETDIGREKSDGAYWPGRLDDLRLYERALTATEVLQLYNASRTGYQQELNWLTRPAWSPGIATGATTYSATAAFALGGIEIAAVAEGPLYSAAASFALGGVDFAATATFNHATVAFLLGGIEIAAAAESDAIYSATAEFALGGIELAAAARVISSATCDFRLGGIAFAAEATAEEPAAPPETPPVLVYGGGGYQPPQPQPRQRPKPQPKTEPRKPQLRYRLLRAGGAHIAVQSAGQATMHVSRTFYAAGGSIDVLSFDAEFRRQTIFDDPAFQKAMDDAIQFGGEDWEAKLSLVVARKMGGVE